MTFPFEVFAPAAMLGIVGWIMVANRRDKMRRDAVEQRERLVRERRTRELGWRLDNRADGDIRYRFEGSTAAGVRWSMKFDSDASSSSARPQLVWQAASLQTPRIELMLGHRTEIEGLTTGAARKMLGAANAVLGRLIGQTLQDLNAFADTAVIASGGRSSADALVAASPGGALARRVMQDAALLRLLQSWPSEVPKGFRPTRDVSARLDRDGLTVTFKGDAPAMPVCEHLANLGAALAAAVRE